MKAKEKAIELVSKFGSKQCALIAVDEIIEVIKPHLNIIYWNEVKQEINKL